MGVTHSICVANRNSMHTVKRWATSLLEHLTEEDEVVIVDSESTDGSREFLRDWARDHGFQFIPRRTNIGQARQLAFASSTGQYVIAHMDTDDTVVSLQEAKRLYHEAVERDPISGFRRAFTCRGFFIMPRDLLLGIGGYPDLHYYEDQLVAYRLARRGQLTASWKVSAVSRGLDPKKRRIGFRTGYSMRRIRDGLRLGIFDARNLQGYLLLGPACLASLPLPRYEFRRDWWNLDVQRDDYLLTWIHHEQLDHKLLIDAIDASGSSLAC